jgi:hypothetical protein
MFRCWTCKLPATSAGSPDIQKLERLALASHVLSKVSAVPQIWLIDGETKRSVIAFR